MAVSDLIHNERTKLLAIAHDTASTAAPIVGVFGPIVTIAYGAESERIDFSLPIIWWSTILWSSAAVALPRDRPGRARETEMSSFEVWFLTMPFVLVGLGALAAYLHGRADDASRRAEADAERVEG